MTLPDLSQLAIILFIAFLIFGAAKIPAIGQAVGVRLSRRPPPRDETTDESR